MTFEDFRHAANRWGAAREPFLFLVDFEMQRPLVVRLADVNPDELLYVFPRNRNSGEQAAAPVALSPVPMSEADYRKKFDLVMRHLQYGDSFLINLTIKTPLHPESRLREIFRAGVAPYKIWYRDEFVFFSPETFIKIEGDHIYSFPMKGTRDVASDPAGTVILADEKEKAEHITIVDLIRNDLSRVARHVQVSRFRYLDKIISPGRALWQVSSEIRGHLSDAYRNRFGDILAALLPAGSISGAPKAKTVSIIREAEGEPRGYYTGVAGIFDGSTLDSCVMIRYIENRGGEYFYRSGGGITAQSRAGLEYQEALAKVYVPVD